MTQEKKDTIPARNVDFHQLTPSDIELILERTDKGYQMRVTLNFKEKTSSGRPRKIFQIHDLGSARDEAIGQYDYYKTKVFNGGYKLHCFGDGTLEVELKQ